MQERNLFELLDELMNMAQTGQITDIMCTFRKDDVYYTHHGIVNENDHDYQASEE